MNLNDFAKKLTLAEGKKVSLPIGQVKEVLRLANTMTDGALYAAVRKKKA